MDPTLYHKLQSGWNNLCALCLCAPSWKVKDRILDNVSISEGGTQLLWIGVSCRVDDEWLWVQHKISILWSLSQYNFETIQTSMPLCILFLVSFRLHWKECMRPWGTVISWHQDWLVNNASLLLKWWSTLALCGSEVTMMFTLGICQDIKNSKQTSWATTPKFKNTLTSGLWLMFWNLNSKLQSMMLSWLQSGMQMLRNQSANSSSTALIKRLEENQISLISFQQSIGGSLSVINKDRLADTDSFFDGETASLVGDEEIVIPEIQDIVIHGLTAPQMPVRSVRESVVSLRHKLYNKWSENKMRTR